MAVLEAIRPAAAAAASIPKIIASDAPTQVQRQIKLASSLPPLLLNFFRKHPPGTFDRSIPPPPDRTVERTPPPVPSSKLSIAPPAQKTLARVSALASSSNPFLPFHNPETLAWRAPAYSLRRQAELYKLGKRYGVMSLLPEAPSDPAKQFERRIEEGLRVKGTGRGQKVKGRVWERQLAGKQEMRRKAMEDMPRMIREWKLRGHGRGWKKWPSGRKQAPLK